MATKTKKEVVEETTEKDSKFVTMDPLNPADINVPKNFDIEETLIDITNADGSVEKYMPVRARQAWKIQNKPTSPMPVTELVKDDNGIVLFKASQFSDDGTIVLATGFGSALFATFPEQEINKAYEMAETRAIGRCLTNLGYGISFKDDGNEGYPIDKENANVSIDSLNNIIESDDNDNPAEKETTATDSKDNTKVVEFDSLSDEDKAVSVLMTEFPIKIEVNNVNMKKEPTWKVLSALNKANESIDKAKDSIVWGTGKGLKGVVNKEYNLKYPEYASFLLELLKNVDLYKAALRKIKTEEYAK